MREAPTTPSLQPAQAAQPAPSLLSVLRTHAARALRNIEFPDTRAEAWKYANLRALHTPDWFSDLNDTDTAHTPAPRFSAGQNVGQNAAPIPGQTASQFLSLHDGHVVAQQLDRVVLKQLTHEHALDELRWRALAARGADEPFALLNAASSQAPLCVDIAENIDGGQLRIAYTTRREGQFQCATRVGIRLAPGSSLTLIEEITPTAGLHNAVTDIDIGAGATLRHIRWTHIYGSGMSIARVFVRVADNANYTAHQQLGLGAFAREEIDIALQGEGACAELSGACCVSRRDQVNLLVRIRHEAPRTRSAANYRGLADDHGRFAFNGRIHILPGAMDVDASLTNKNLLLSRDAEIDTKPELEIYADDVRCSHGATIGQLDATALFYLQSRGIDADAASVLLRRGFALTALSSLAGTAEGEVLTQLLLERLEAMA